MAVRGDVLDEPDEFFALRLSAAAGAVVGPGEGVGRIRRRRRRGDPPRRARRGHERHRPRSRGAGPGRATWTSTSSSWRRFASYEVTVDAASGDLGDVGPIVEVLARDMHVDRRLGSERRGARPDRAHDRVVERVDAASYRYVRVRSAGCTTDCGADDTYRIRLRETTGRVARFNQTGGQRTVMILQNTTGEWIETEVHYRRADGTFAGASLVPVGPRRTMVLPAPETAQGTSGSILVLHDGPLGALAGKAVSLDEATGLAFDTPMTTRPR